MANNVVSENALADARLCYEPPIILPLGQMAAALGAGCASGSTATTGCAPGIGAAFSGCQSGLTGATKQGKCKIGSGATETCHQGDAPATNCGLGNADV